MVTPIRTLGIGDDLIVLLISLVDYTLKIRNRYVQAASNDLRQVSSSTEPQEGDAESKSVKAVDREIEGLLNATKRQSEELELEDEDEIQETSTEESQVQYDELSCTPQKSIAFLKTHKTGSSTLTNILNRYADLRELSIALPREHLYRFGWPGYFSWRSVDMFRLNGQPAHILCNHARYYRPAMDIVMQSDTKYITILRDPANQFESTFNYMELYRDLNLAKFSNPMEVFLKNPYGHLQNLTKRVRSLPESMNLVRNGMFFDLGFSSLMGSRKDSELHNAIANIEKEFSLVLIMEYFDESLVLLKREFCWDLDDVIYIKQNQRKYGNNTSHKNISARLKHRIRNWNRADALLYKHFNKTFWEKVKQHGRGFYQDLAELKRKNLEMYRDCVSPEEVTETAFRLSGKIRGFKLNDGVSRFNRYLCEKLLTNEIDYINYFRRKLNPHSEYQKQLRAAGKAPYTPGENSISERIRAFQSKQVQINAGNPVPKPKP
ncbi:Galactose-3-O-sulfotransferase 3 [Stylophora pistillata]|uniref:Galactose-3-O-sulfotransferase 3 n=1 Tax=Stylophora pistillata TaxID=50429 RepID=A0A2B4SC06_STYPI|nr:Galactose-3-O-sulfotransferase 3 [Stylophora pistillata]